MMRQVVLPAIGVMAVCGLVQAEVVHWSQLIGPQAADTQSPRWGGLTIDISGLTSNDFEGDRDNIALSVFYGAGGDHHLDRVECEPDHRRHQLGG